MPHVTAESPHTTFFERHKKAGHLGAGITEGKGRKNKSKNVSYAIGVLSKYMYKNTFMYDRRKNYKK